MDIKRKIVTIKSKKAVTSLLDRLIDEIFLLSLKEFTTEELIAELRSRKGVSARSHSFCGERKTMIEVTFPEEGIYERKFCTNHER